MPTYEYKCLNKHEFERVLPVSEHNSLQVCECGAQARRILSVPRLYLKPDIRYTSPIDDSPITSEKARREDLARNNCSPYEPEIKQDYHRRIEEGQKELERKFDETVDREIAKMSSDKLERLGNELKYGATAEPIRCTPPAQPIKVEIDNAR
jgi:putative FmdB family regulatory protein